MNTYIIHGVEFPVDSIDGCPDLYSINALLNTLANKARACNGYGHADTAEGVFVFDRGYGGETDAKDFAAEVAAMGVWVTDIKIVDHGPAAWGGKRFEVSLKPQTKFCYENVFGK